MLCAFKLLRFVSYTPFCRLFFVGTIAGRRLPVPLFKALRKFAGVVISGTLRNLSDTQRVDLSTPKAYRVYASNGAYVTYTVTAYTEEPSPTQSLWEKLQNQINSNPNWWELAEYQKKTGYYK